MVQRITCKAKKKGKIIITQMKVGNVLYGKIKRVIKILK